MKQKFTGQELHSLMIANRKSLHGSAKVLGISTEELQSYFDSDDTDFIEEIRNKLNLLNIVDIPNALTPAALDLLETKDEEIKLQQKLLIAEFDKILHLYVIIEKYLPEIFQKEQMEEHYQDIRNYLIKHRGHSF